MKNILVTGISKGLGLEIAKVLLEKNHNVWGINRTVSDELKELQEQYINSLHIKQFDLMQSENVKNLLNKDFITIDIPINGFVNNAAIAYDDIVTNINLEPLENMFRVNVFTPMLITKYVIRNMIYNKIKGSIIHLSSISVHTGYKGLAMYAATKGALEAFSKNTAREWGVKGIRSNAVVAGFMETSMSSKLDEEQKNRIYNRTSLKSPVSMLSVAQTVKFLIEDDSTSITGQNIFVDSGTI